jgi:hypothetical protein
MFETPSIATYIHLYFAMFEYKKFEYCNYVQGC